MKPLFTATRGPKNPATKKSIASLLVLLAAFACAQAEPGRPIQGTDAGLDHDPERIHVASTKSDENGKFVFANLKAGKYVLTITPPQTKALINTSHSNIRHPNITMVKGVEVANVSVTLGAGAPAPVKIAFTKDGGSIVGVVMSPATGTKAPTGAAK